MGTLTELRSNELNNKVKGAGKNAARASGKQPKVIDINIRQAEPRSCLSLRQKEELVISYRMKARKLARSILRKWHARLDLQEVDSIVDLSLCEAVRRFNPAMGASFMTFLFYHLRGNLIRAISAAATQHIVPLQEIEPQHSASEEASDGQRSKSNANAIEIAEALCGNDYPMPDELLLKRELIDLSQQACGRLDELAKEVIFRIYIQGQQLIDIANSLGYSRCHISRVKKKALETLYNDLTDVMGVPSDLGRPDFEDEGEVTTSRAQDRRKIFRRRPRSRKASLAQKRLAAAA
ncbi:MAG: sigma-70 family RNA polymerase sigma factor [Deltaproteobacteria bacterium]|nr:sigma-70 family RNA polymerase sigma factor [Deltaproteobacteria bacterium]